MTIVHLICKDTKRVISYERSGDFSCLYGHCADLVIVDGELPEHFKDVVKSIVGRKNDKVIYLNKK